MAMRGYKGKKHIGIEEDPTRREDVAKDAGDCAGSAEWVFECSVPSALPSGGAGARRGQPGELKGVDERM